MPNQQTHNHIPALRFPDFANVGEWEVKRLGDCLLQTPDYGINAPAVPFSNNLPTYLRITDISDDGRFIKEGKVSVDTILTKDNSLQDGDIVFARTGASVGKVYKYRKEDGPLVFAGFLIRIKPDETRLNSGFLFQYLFTSTYKKWVEVTSTRSGQPGINSADIASLLIPVPPLAEQQRIAACLSAADEMIASTNGKLEQLKAYKKGLMQKLFPAKDQKLPELRFKEFEKDGEWEEKKLASIVHRITTGKLDANAMVSNGKYRFYTCAKDYAFINEYAFDTEALLVSGNGAHLGYIHYYNGKFNAYQRTYVLSGFQCDIFYLKYYLESFLPDRINKEKKEGNTPYIVLSTITEMDISLPSNSEQHKIADCLSSVDEMINQYTNKIALLEQYKKGLMQQMFPTSK